MKKGKEWKQNLLTCQQKNDTSPSLISWCRLLFPLMRVGTNKEKTPSHHTCQSNSVGGTITPWNPSLFLLFGDGADVVLLRLFCCSDGTKKKDLLQFDSFFNLVSNSNHLTTPSQKKKNIQLTGCFKPTELWASALPDTPDGQQQPISSGHLCVLQNTFCCSNIYIYIFMSCAPPTITTTTRTRPGGVALLPFAITLKRLTWAYLLPGGWSGIHFFFPGPDWPD